MRLCWLLFLAIFCPLSRLLNLLSVVFFLLVNVYLPSLVWPGVRLLAPVVQRPDNFILWISHYPTVSICAKTAIFSCVPANMDTLTTVKFGSV